MLDLAALDGQLSLLGHRKRTLPQLAELQHVTVRRDELARRQAGLRADVSDLTRQQAKADADVEQVRARRVRNEQRLAAGQVSSPRELEQLQHEVGTLERRIAALEDAELEIMEQLETASTELEQVSAELARAEASASELGTSRDGAVSELDQQAFTAAAERRQVAAEIPEPVLAVYERVRSQVGSDAAAALRRHRCEGCRLELTPADLAEIAAAASDELTRCPQCNRLLVRLPDSGL